MENEYQLALLDITLAFQVVNKCFCTQLEDRARMFGRSKVNVRDRAEYVKKLVDIAGAIRVRGVNAEVDSVQEDAKRLSNYLESIIGSPYFLPHDHVAAILFRTASDCFPFVQQLLSLLHIARAHPRDAGRRANKIVVDIRGKLG